MSGRLIPGIISDLAVLKDAGDMVKHLQDDRNN